MKTKLLLIGLSLGLFISSCSKDLLKDDANEPVGVELNKAFPDGFVPKCVDKTIGVAMLKTSPTAKTLAVPYKAQETSYWCGPASSQMVNWYFGTQSSQASIASQEGTSPNGGTYVYRIAQFFNDPPLTGGASLPSWWKWEYVQVSSQSDFETKVRWSVGDYSAPQVWHLKTYPSSTYHLPGYVSNYGHYVCGRGYDYSASTHYVKYQDPWYGTGGGANKSTSANNMYHCIIANASYIIY